METKKYNLQDRFLQSIRNQRMSIQVFLVNGIRLVGQLEALDSYALLLKNEGISRLSINIQSPLFFHHKR